jgi:diphosphomevalonate decarboxylase
MTHYALAVAHANIAFIKYWGNRDADLRLPVNGSISMNLKGMNTRTRVLFDPGLTRDHLILNQVPQRGPGLERVRTFLDHVRERSGVSYFARVESENNFPMGAGIASSASAFAALSLAAAAAAGLDLTEAELSRLARLGSGSASRSVPAGFVEWKKGHSEETCFAETIAPPGHWDLRDCVAVVSGEHKPVGSTRGHALAETSPLQTARVQDAPRRLAACRLAILEKDFERLADVVEADSNLMHAVMMTSDPPLFYWEPATLMIMRTVRTWRREGLPVCYTIDAGPNVHVISPQRAAGDVKKRLQDLPGVQDVLIAAPGGPAQVLSRSQDAV